MHAPSHAALDLDRARQADRDRGLAAARLRRQAPPHRRPRPPGPSPLRRALAARLHALADRLAPREIGPA